MMEVLTPTQSIGDENRKASLAVPRPTYFVGSWLREFLLSNYQLVGKTFMMKNLCICVDMVFDIDEYQDGSLVYKITDTDVSLRAIFTADSLKINDSPGSESEGFSPSQLPRSGIILEECRLLHLTIPGTMFGDFVLEVFKFTWAAPTKRFPSNHITEILHLAPQFIWCSEDPELQVIVKKVYDKRGGGMLSMYTVTSCLDVLLQELCHHNTAKDIFSISPEIIERFGLNSPGSYNGNEVLHNLESDKVKETNMSRGSEKQVAKLSTPIAIPTSQNLDFPVTQRSRDLCDIAAEMSELQDHKTTSVSDCKKSEASLRKNEVCSVISKVRNSFTNDPRLEMKPVVILKRLDSPTKTPATKSSFFLDSMRSKRTLPKWVPKSIKETSPIFSPKKFPKKNSSNDCKSPSPAQLKLKDITPIFDSILQTELTESQVALPLTDSLCVSLSQRDEQETHSYGKPNSAPRSQRVNPDLYEDAESKDSMVILLPPSTFPEIVCSTDYTKFVGVDDVITNKQPLQTPCGTNKKKVKQQQNYASVYQDAFSLWLKASSNKGRQLVPNSPNLNSNQNFNPSLKKVESLVISKKQVEYQDKPVAGHRKKSPQTPDLKQRKSPSTINTTELNRSPIPRVVLSRLPTDTNTKTSKVLKSTSKAARRKIKENALKSSSLTSTVDSDIEIVYESEEASPKSVKRNSSKKDLTKQMRTDLTPTSNCRNSAINQPIASSPSEECPLLLSLCSRKSTTSSSSKNAGSGHNILSNVVTEKYAKTCQERRSPGLEFTNHSPTVQIVDSDRVTPELELTNHSPTVQILDSDRVTCLKRKSPEQELNSPKKLCTNSSEEYYQRTVCVPPASTNSTEETVQRIVPTPSGVQGTNAQHEIITQADTESDSWAYPYDLMLSVWKTVDRGLNQCFEPNS